MDHLYRLTLACLVLLGAMLAPLPALAQDYSQCMTNSTSTMCPDQGTAASAAASAANAIRDGQVASCNSIGGGNCDRFTVSGPEVFQQLGWPNEAYGLVRYKVCASAGCASLYANVDRLFPKDANCAARNDTLGESERVYMGTPPTCVGGCQLSHGAVIEVTVGGGGGVISTTSNTQYTGEACSLLPGQEEPPTPGPDTPDTEEACKPLGDGQTACVKPNGNYCASASNGATFCWGPTETGEKVQTDKLQRRSPGTERPNDQPSTPPPPPSTQWQPNSSHSSNSPTHGSYTVTNYSTVGGDTGHNTGGDGDGDDDEGEPGTVSGGGKCPHDGGELPSCTGDISAVECAQLVQTYLTRCAAEKLSAGQITGGIACSSVEPLVCTNMSPQQCWLAAQAKRQACNLERIGDAFGEAEEGQQGDEEIDVAQAWVDGNFGNGEDGNGSGNGDGDIDSGGWISSRSCPVIPSVSVFGTTLSFDISEFCWFLEIGAGLVLMFAAIACARIIGEAV